MENLLQQLIMRFLKQKVVFVKQFSLQLYILRQVLVQVSMLALKVENSMV
jgi:hypothetical protein